VEVRSRPSRSRSRAAEVADPAAAAVAAASSMAAAAMAGATVAGGARVDDELTSRADRSVHRDHDHLRHRDRDRSRDRDRDRDRRRDRRSDGPPPGTPPQSGDLLTVVCTDIVGSTRLAVALGDQRWYSVLSEHNAVVREL